MELGWSDKCLSTQHHELLLLLMADLGFREPRTIDVKIATQPGDNYLGCVYRVRARGTRNIGIEEEQWIMKTMPQNEARRQMFGILKYFKREVIIYERVLPELSQQMGPEKSPLAVPRCLRAFCNGQDDYLVLDDLRPEGFSMVDRVLGLDAPHCHLVLRELARLHALSLVMKSKQPKRFQDLSVLLDEIVFDYPAPLSENKHISFNQMCDKNVQLLRKSFTDDSKYIQKLNEFIGDDYYVTMSKLCLEVEEPWAVITHGDCWTNNLLFKYSDDGLPTDVRLLDFQISRYGSPVMDIAYLVFCCTTGATRSAHYSALMDGYHAALDTELESLGASASLLPRERVDAEMVRCGGRWGLGMALWLMTIFCWNASEIPHMDSLVSEEEGCGIGAVFGGESSNDDECQTRLADILRNIVDLGLI